MAKAGTYRKTVCMIYQRRGGDAKLAYQSKFGKKKKSSKTGSAVSSNKGAKKPEVKPTNKTGKADQKKGSVVSSSKKTGKSDPPKREEHKTPRQGYVPKHAAKEEPKVEQPPFEPPFNYNTFWCSIKEQCTCTIICMLMCGGEALDGKNRLKHCPKYPEIVKDPREKARLEMYLRKFKYHFDDPKMKPMLTRLGVLGDNKGAGNKPVERKGFKLDEPVKRKAIKI